MNLHAELPAEPELNQLLAELCANELTAVDQHQLIMLLQQSAEARETYVRYMSVHAELMWRFVGKHDPSLQNETAPTQAASPNSQEPRTATVTAEDSHASGPPSAWLGFLAHAARVIPGGDVVVGSLVILAVVGALCGVAFYIHHSRQTEIAGQAPTDNSAAPTNSGTATNTDMATGPPARPGDRVGSLQTDLLATWPSEATSPGSSSALAGRKYELASGRAEVALANGARLVIGGPAIWQLDSECQLSLDRGQVVAYVPAAARGFTVITPTAEIVDLGTEFIVEVAAADETRLAVLRGSVQLATISPAVARSPAAGRTVLSVSAGQAMTVSGNDAHAVVVPTNFESPWVQHIARLEQSSVADEVIAFQALPTGLSGNQPGTNTVATDFEVREPIRVTSLGVFDSLGDGIDPSSNLTVKLWAIDDHGTPERAAAFTGKQVLAEMTFASASPGTLRGCFRFKPLPEPIDLPPGLYSVAVDGFTLQNPFFNFNYLSFPSLTKNPRAEHEVATSRYAIMQRGPRYSNPPTPGLFPDEAETAGSYFAGSFMYAPLETSK